MAPDGSTLKTVVEEGWVGAGVGGKHLFKILQEVKGRNEDSWSLVLVCVSLPWVFYLQIFSQFPQQTCMKHLQHLRPCDKHMRGPRDVGDDSRPPGLCSMVDVRVKD